MATPVLVRLVRSTDDSVASLLIKTTTLDLKYISTLESLSLRFFRVGADGAYLAYALSLEIGGEPFVIWSVAEWLPEIDGIRSMARSKRCNVYLYNEVSINVAESNFICSVESLDEILSAITLYERPDPRGEIPWALVGDALGAEGESEFSDRCVSVELSRDPAGWSEIHPIYITDAGKQAPLSLLSPDEGAQQEQLGTWLVSHLQPARSVRSPRFRDGAHMKELTDLLFAYESGCFLVESKALAILSRDTLPTRAKLRRDVAKDVRKAVKQLGGAIRSIRRGVPIVDSDGVPMEVGLPEDAPHLIVLVPDLNLLAGLTEYGGEELRDLARKYRAYFHFLDPKELLRVVQAGELTVKVNQGFDSEILAVDLYLIRRFELALTRADPNFQVLARADGR
jgi:hypothetical protein